MPELEIFETQATFQTLGLRDDVRRGLEDAGFVHPTTIQAKLIPAILAGKDVIGQAKTGTGKTAAFGLPILHLAEDDVPSQALILTPTRELAAQVAAEINDLARHVPIKATCIIGGESARRQQKAVEGGAQIIVGTPGRITDLHSRGQLRFDNIRFVVLDEVDRMFDIGFRDDIRRILNLVKTDHQTIFVSATLSEEIERLARRHMKPDAEKILTVSGSLTVSLVDQKYLAVEPWDKRALLLHLLRHEEPDTTLVFCKTKATVRKVTEYLKRHNMPAKEIHGDLHQKQRNKVIESLRSGKLDVLVASDLAARGLDVDHISHVINYDLPEDPDIYIHRVGRTARAGRRGIAWAFVTPEEGQRLTNIEKLTGVLIEKMEYPDFKPGPVPQDVAELRQRDDMRQKAVSANTSRQPGTDIASLDEDELRKRFPSGIIPKNPTAAMPGNRMRRRRR